MRKNADHADMSARWITGLLLAMSIGLFAARGIDIYTTPASSAANQTDLSSVVESLVGAGHVRISDTGNGDIIVLLNGPENEIDDALSNRITKLIKAAEPNRAITLEQFPFAEGTTPTPSMVDTAELIALAIFAGLTAWLGLTSLRQSTTTESMSEPSQHHVPRQMPIERPPQPPLRANIDEAANLARRKPAHAAAVIREWLHERGESI